MWKQCCGPVLFLVLLNRINRSVMVIWPLIHQVLWKALVICAWWFGPQWKVGRGCVWASCMYLWVTFFIPACIVIQTFCHVPVVLNLIYKIFSWWSTSAGNSQEGHVTAVQWMPHKNKACWCPCHTGWWSGCPGVRGALKQWAAHEEVHADLCPCSRGKKNPYEDLSLKKCKHWIVYVEDGGVFSVLVKGKAVRWSVVTGDYFYRVLWLINSMYTMTSSGMKMKFLEIRRRNLMMVRVMFNFYLSLCI